MQPSHANLRGIRSFSRALDSACSSASASERSDEARAVVAQQPAPHRGEAFTELAENDLARSDPDPLQQMQPSRTYTRIRHSGTDRYAEATGRSRGMQRA
jgi:hypothetical protein